MTLFQILTNLADKIEELDDILLSLYKLEESEEKSKITLHFTEVTNEITDLILELDSKLLRSFDEEERDVFNKKFVKVVRRCKNYDTDYFEAKEDNLINKNIEESHDVFTQHIQKLIIRINSYNKKNTHKILTFKQAIEEANRKMNEYFLRDILGDKL